MDVQLIVWRDSMTAGGQKDRETMLKHALQPALMESVGYIFAEDDEAVVLIQTRCLPMIGQEEEYKDALTVPKVNILERKKLAHFP